MRRILSVLLPLFPLAAVLYAASVGSGAPNPTAVAGFVNAYLRGSFQSLTLPPLADVSSFGPTGLIQEFPSRANSKTNYALVKVDANTAVTANDTLQVFSDVFSTYSSIGVSNAGYPTTDTLPCPANSYGTCDYQTFTKNYAVFAYSSPDAVTYTVKDPVFTEWNAQGGVAGSLGLATDIDRAVTSPSTIAGNQQLFLNGAVYSYNLTTSGGTSTRTLSVFGTTYQTYTAGGGLPMLGYPTAEEVVLSSGLHRQTFEIGRIEWSSAVPPQVLYPVGTVSISGAGPGLSLHLGDSTTLTAATFDSNGQQVSNRTLSWTASNGQAVSIQSNGYSAVVKAIARGVANVIVTSEGKTSAPLQIRVDSPCCDVGEGAPTAAVAKAFQDAVARNRLVLALPNGTPVVRAAGGYTQLFTVASGGAPAVVSESDKASVAFALTGPVYAAFVAAGGFAGKLGYPSSDLTSGGTQLFESGMALAGSPVRLVPTAVRAKWAGLGYETGPLGPPSSDATAYASPFGSSGVVQSFAGGTIYAPNAGPAYIATGLILSRYLALLGPGGLLGAPTSDVSTTGSVQRQNFENGYIDLQPGAQAAVEHPNVRKPSITVYPTRVIPGSRVHITVTGFAPQVNLVISQTGQSDFRVAAAAGTYAWDVFVGPTGALATYSVSAKDSGGSDIATASYTVVSLPSLTPTLSIVSGDAQSGNAGSLLPLPLVAVLKDGAGNPLAGVPVAAVASPGASVSAPSVTDANGLVSLSLRLPPGGLAIISLSAGGKIVSFSARATGSALSGFPALSQQDTATMVGGGTQTLAAKGSLTTALAGVLQYFQSAGKLASPNGLATPQLLNTFLTTNGGYTASSSGDLIANPWVSLLFAGVRGGVLVKAPTLDSVHDALAAGVPVLMGVSLKVDGASAGSTFVVATGTDDGGGILISDPAFGRLNFADYSNGFPAGSHNMTGTLGSAVVISPAASNSSGFVVATSLGRNATAVSASGSCAVLDTADLQAPGQTAAASVSGVRFLFCDGTQAGYQVSFGAGSTPVTVLDLANGSGQTLPAIKAAVFSIGRTASGLQIAPQALRVDAVVSAASFMPGVAPGTIATLFGAGLSDGSPALPTVTVGGIAAYVYAAYPFQVNFEIPENLSPGSARLTASGPLGAVSRDLVLVETAGAIFVIPRSDGLTGAAAVNQNGSINDSANPAKRGEYVSLYGTGLGAKIAKGSFSVARDAVRVVINGSEIAPAYAGTSPGLVGVDQINFLLPSDLAPSLSATLILRQNGVDSAPVLIAFQ